MEGGGKPLVASRQVVGALLGALALAAGLVVLSSVKIKVKGKGKKAKWQSNARRHGSTYIGEMSTQRIGDDAFPQLEVEEGKALVTPLENLGNTCFLNAALQLLASSPSIASLSDLFADDDDDGGGNSGHRDGHARGRTAKTRTRSNRKRVVYRSIGRFLSGMARGRAARGKRRGAATAPPSAFIHELRRAGLALGDQNDAHEALVVLLDGLVEEATAVAEEQEAAAVAGADLLALVVGCRGQRGEDAAGTAVTTVTAATASAAASASTAASAAADDAKDEEGGKRQGIVVDPRAVTGAYPLSEHSKKGVSQPWRRWLSGSAAGIEATLSRCLGCGAVALNAAIPLRSLSLSIPTALARGRRGPATISECLAAHSRPERVENATCCADAIQRRRQRVLRQRQRQVQQALCEEDEHEHEPCAGGTRILSPRVVRQPRMLVLHLRRLLPSGFKISARVEFPLRLRLPSAATFSGHLKRVAEAERASDAALGVGRGAAAGVTVAAIATALKLKREGLKESDSPALLLLRAVVVHHGGGRGGHYTCYVRRQEQGGDNNDDDDDDDDEGMQERREVKGNGDGEKKEVAAPKREQKKRMWLHVSDDKVTATTWEEVRGCQAYMLLYERD